MGIAARGRIKYNYTYCTVCTFHLLARQDADFVGMRNIARRLLRRPCRAGKFPYLFAARGKIRLDYACCTNCAYHLLAWQYTAFAVCTKRYNPKGVSPKGQFFEIQ